MNFFFIIITTIIILATTQVVGSDNIDSTNVKSNPNKGENLYTQAENHVHT